MSLVLIVYTYSGYPLLLFFISLVVRHEIKKEPITPLVTLIISAYNEEKHIAEKIENSLALRYPKEQLEIIVSSDCSTDKTNEIVMGYADRGIILFNAKKRSGKSANLNHAVALARGEIIVFSDANSIYPQNTLHNMARNFSDNSIGLVTGTTSYIASSGNSTADAIGSYTRLERFTKILESKIGSCVGADGAIFAVRKALFLRLNEDDINDFVVPLNVVKQGYRVIMDDEVFCREMAITNHRTEFQRQVRITCRTLRSIFSNVECLIPFIYPIFSFELLSHKLLRFMVPFFLMSLFGTNIFLLQAHGAFTLTLFLQVLGYLLAALHLSGRTLVIQLPLISLVADFLWINFAFLGGWIRFFSGERYIAWEHERISG